MENQPDKEKKFYSREELKEFEKIINKKLEDARAEHKKLSEDLKSSSDVNYTDLGTESQDREQTEILMARQEKFIMNLEYAYARIQNGTYGICKVTGELIPKERLRIVPHTTTSIEAKNNQSNLPQSRG